MKNIRKSTDNLLTMNLSNSGYFALPDQIIPFFVMHGLQKLLRYHFFLLSFLIGENATDNN